jgi:hypothetical protein
VIHGWGGVADEVLVPLNKPKEAEHMLLRWIKGEEL